MLKRVLSGVLALLTTVLPMEVPWLAEESTPTAPPAPVSSPPDPPHGVSVMDGVSTETVTYVTTQVPTLVSRGVEDDWMTADAAPLPEVYRFEISGSGDADVVVASGESEAVTRFEGSQHFTSAEWTVAEPLAPGVEYRVRAHAATGDASSDWSEWTTFVVSPTPPEPADLLPADGATVVDSRRLSGHVSAIGSSDAVFAQFVVHDAEHGYLVTSGQSVPEVGDHEAIWTLPHDLPPGDLPGS